MKRTRILVAARCFRDRRRVSFAEAQRDAPQVGIVRASSQEPAIVVVVKVTLSYARGGPAEDRTLELAEQEPISLARPSLLAGAGSEELEVCSDLVPAKGGTDVLLVGHAYRAPGSPSVGPDVTRIEACLRLNQWSRAFAVAATGIAMKLPLTRRYLRALGDNSKEEQVGPSRGTMPDPPPIEHPEGFDIRSYNVAPPDQRLRGVPDDVEIELRSLSPDAPRVVMKLPAIAPRVLVERRHRTPAELRMRRDTLWINTDEQRIALVWRAGLLVSDLDDPGVERVVVSLEDAGAPRSWEEIRRQLPRGAFFYAVEAADLIEGAPAVPQEDDLLRAARYATWAHTDAPDPILDVAEYAAMSAEMMEGRAEKSSLLARVGLDEYGWTLEQRAWSSRISAARGRGSKELPELHRRLFVAAQDRLADSAEERRTLAEYAAIGAESERIGIGPALAARGLTRPAWQRLQRRFSAALQADPALAAEHRRLLAEARRGAGAGAGATRRLEANAAPLTDGGIHTNAASREG